MKEENEKLLITGKFFLNNFSRVFNEVLVSL